MNSSENGNLLAILARDEQAILADWLKLQRASTKTRADLMTEGELRQQSQQLLALLRTTLERGATTDVQSQPWSEVRELLTTVSNSRVLQGFSPSETATFVFSLKEPLFNRLRVEFEKKPAELVQTLWLLTVLLDGLGLFTTEVYHASRNSIIDRQQRELMELSTPVVQLWQGILALPLIGTLDSERTQVVMENLLTKIVETGAPLAIIDITGVPTVDTLVAQHLLKTVAAARLMGADCRPSSISV
jgi:rsbT co-antagonist protein RsbR